MAKGGSFWCIKAFQYFTNNWGSDGFLKILIAIPFGVILYFYNIDERMKIVEIWDL